MSTFSEGQSIVLLEKAGHDGIDPNRFKLCFGVQDISLSIPQSELEKNRIDKTSLHSKYFQL